MARAATTSDVFNAIAEPRRRQILSLLAGGERNVNEVVAALDLAQPQVSKHLRVLKEVGVVNMRGSGRQRIYSVNGEHLKPVHDWVQTFEKFWKHHLQSIKRRAEEKMKERDSDSDNSKKKEKDQ